MSSMLLANTSRGEIKAQARQSSEIYGDVGFTVKQKTQLSTLIPREYGLGTCSCLPF